MNYKYLICIIQVFSIFALNKGVYEVDDRMDFDELVEERHREWALSTAAMIPSFKIRDEFDGTCSIKGKMLRQTGICEYERFSQQLTAADCSGFLVSKDTIVTAGHCIRDRSDCVGWRWVFDYKKGGKYQAGRTIKINNSSVYRCVEIVKRHNDGEIDFAVIKLDRPVLDRQPLKLSSNINLTKNTKLTLVGHPSGLPVKIAPSAKVLSEDMSAPFFMADTDSFVGNSGSPVINSQTGEVEGILVRGDNDYEPVKRRGKSCLIPVVCTKEDHCEGEAVMKISFLAEYL